MWTTKKILAKFKKDAFEKGKSEGVKEGLKAPSPGYSKTEVSSLLQGIPEDLSYIATERDYLSRLFDKDKSQKPGSKAVTVLTNIYQAVSDAYTAFVVGVSFDTAKLYRIQQRTATMYREDNLIRAIGNLLVKSVIGRGVAFTTGNYDVDNFLRLYWSKAGIDFEARQKEVVLHRYLLGEYFLVYFVEEGKVPKSGAELPKVTVRKFYPWEIKNLLVNEDDDEDIQGVVRTSPKDRGDRRYNLIGAYLDPENAPKIDNAESGVFVQYIKLGDGFDQRGYPQVFLLLRWAGIIRELIFDIASKFHEWSKVFYVLTINRKDKDWSADTGRRAPRGGTILVNSPEAKWESFQSKLDAEGVGGVWDMLMYYFSAGCGFPYQYIVHDYSQNALASTREARLPFNQLVTDQQDSIEPELDMVLRVGLKAAVDAGILPPTSKIPILVESAKFLDEIRRINMEVTDPAEKAKQIRKTIVDNKGEKSVDTINIPIALNMPKVTLMSEKDQADVIKTYNDVGFPLQTLTNLAGLDWETVKAQKLAQVDFDVEIERRRSELQGGDENKGEPTVPDKLAGGND